jgi:hypothetical protein
LNCTIHGKCVITIYADTSDTVSSASDNYTITCQ